MDLHSRRRARPNLAIFRVFGEPHKLQLQILFSFQIFNTDVECVSVSHTERNLNGDMACDL